MSSQVRQLREAARQMVRELRLLGDAHGSLGITNSQVHALIDLEQEGELGVLDLSRRLRLDKSSTSRLIAALEKARFVEQAEHTQDGRRKFLRLTPAGQAKLKKIHEQADERVLGAFRFLNQSERKQIAESLELYANALKRSSQE